MKLISKNYVDTSVCIHAIKDGILVGSFFEEKPEPNDLLELRGCWLGMYKILEILDQKDSKVQSECTHNPVGARMKLRVEKIADTPQGIIAIKMEMMDVLRDE